MTPTYSWRGPFENMELNRLHAEAFRTRVYDAAAWNWVTLCEQHSLGWVTAREDECLVGFVNVLWDGLVHAWIQDLMVAKAVRHRGIGTRLVSAVRAGAKDAGCEWLHVDFEESLVDFYYRACGFTPTPAGLLSL